PVTPLFAGSPSARHPAHRQAHREDDRGHPAEDARSGSEERTPPVLRALDLDALETTEARSRGVRFTDSESDAAPAVSVEEARDAAEAVLLRKLRAKALS